MNTGGVGPDKISIAVVDGQNVVHAGVEAWLTGSRPPIKVAGSFSDPARFIALYPAATPEIDVVLFGLQYERGGPQFSALRKLCLAGHKVIVYSHVSSDEIILMARDIGAMSYIAKFESGAHLREAIYAVASGKPYIGPTMARALLNDKTVGRPRLTEREREVLVAWFQTESKMMVAERLFIEPSTVRGHLERIRAKYAEVGRPATTKAALTVRAIQDGILCTDDL